MMYVQKNCTVVFDAESKTDAYAAGELIKYANKMTGTRLSLSNESVRARTEILVGAKFCKDYDLRQTKLGLDGYVICQNQNKLLLYGQGTRGTLYAVYAFLEKFGVAFYAPDCEVVPKKKTLEIEDGYYEAYTPPMQMRDVMWSMCFDPAFTAKQRVNRGHFRKFPEEIGGQMRFAGYFGHTLGELAETGYDAPEPCLTDEAIYQTVLKNVRQRLKDNPGANYVSVSQNDDFRYCTCEKCKEIDEREQSHAGTMIAFVNRIADDIKDEYPDVLVHTFAYQYTRKPPKYLKPRDNVLIQLCSIECCFRHPLETCDTPAPAPWMEGTVGDFKQDLLGWSKIAKNIHVWDYTTNFHHYFQPFPNLKVLRENVRFFAENGVTGVLEQGNINSPASGEFGNLKGFLLGKLLWNPYMSEEEYQKLICDFLTHYYGAGWRYIKQYIDALHDATEDVHIGIYYMPTRNLPPERGVPLMHKAKQWFEKAEHRAETQRQKQHVLLSSLQVEYYLQIAEYQTRYENGTEKQRREYVARNKDLHKLILEYKVYMNPDITLPESVDYTVSPHLWHKLG